MKQKFEFGLNKYQISQENKYFLMIIGSIEISFKLILVESLSSRQIQFNSPAGLRGLI